MTPKIFAFITATSFLLAPFAPQLAGPALGDCSFEEVREWDAWSQEEGCEGNYTLEEARETCAGINAECNLNMSDAELQSCKAILYANVLRFVNAKPKRIDAVSYTVADMRSNFDTHRKSLVTQIDRTLADGTAISNRLAADLKSTRTMLEILPIGRDALNEDAPSPEEASRLANNLQAHADGNPDLQPLLAGACVELQSYAQFVHDALNEQPVITHTLIPHVTSVDSSFQTSLILTNHGSSDRTFVLQGYSKTGQILETASGDIAAHETVSYKPNDLFSNPDISHIAVEEAKGIDITVSYQAGVEGCPVHLKTTSEAEHTWRFFPGDWSQVWDGLAMVNQGNDIAKVQIRHINNKGVIVNTYDLENLQALAPMAKGLIILNDLGIELSQGSQIQISATQNLSVVALRGSLRDGSNFMWENHMIAD